MPRNLHSAYPPSRSDCSRPRCQTCSYRLLSYGQSEPHVPLSNIALTESIIPLSTVDCEDADNTPRRFSCGDSADCSQPRLRSDAKANLERILNSAREVFAAQGLDATLADVAKHAGVGVGTVYRRFASKDELIQALFDTRCSEIETIAATAREMPDAGKVLSTFST